jgi:putative flippase GtrA
MVDSTLSPEPRGPRGLRDSGFRFLLVGGLNTAVTAGCLAVLANFIDPRLAYTIVFVAGVAFATVMADRFVFGVRLGAKGMLAYAATYLAVYLIGLGVVALIDHSGLPSSASALVVLVTAPLNFLAGRLIARRVHDQRTPTPEQGQHS